MPFVVKTYYVCPTFESSSLRFHCTYVCMCTYVCVYVPTYVCVCMYVCVRTYVCMYLHTYVYMCVYVCTYVPTYVRAYVFVECYNIHVHWDLIYLTTSVPHKM